MFCSRCEGLTVDETLCSPFEGSSHAWVPVTRCLNCGNLEDALIRRARCIPGQRLRSSRPGPKRRGVWMDGGIAADEA